VLTLIVIAAVYLIWMRFVYRRQLVVESVDPAPALDMQE
jgi:hypothetical protein